MQSTITVYVPLEMVPDGHKVKKSADGYEYLVKDEIVVYNEKGDKTHIKGNSVKYLVSQGVNISAESINKKVFYQADGRFLAENVNGFDCDYDDCDK